MNIIVAVWLCFDAGSITHGQAMEVITNPVAHEYIVIDDTASKQDVCNELLSTFTK